MYFLNSYIKKSGAVSIIPVILSVVGVIAVFLIPFMTVYDVMKKVDAHAGNFWDIFLSFRDMCGV